MTPELERAYHKLAMVACDIIETSDCNDGDCFEVHQDLHQELAAAYRAVHHEQQKEPPPSSQEDHAEYMIYTKLHDMPFAFIGKHRRDLETNNWHYYEKANGELIHFRKEHMIAVLGDTAESNISNRVTHKKRENIKKINEIEQLLDAVDAVVNGWSFYPETEYGSNDALIQTELLLDLEKALAAVGQE